MRPFLVSYATRKGEASMETLIYEKGAEVAQITFNRPEVLNAQSNQATHELFSVANQIANDPDIRIVTIRGNGRAFSTGIDLKELSLGVIKEDYFRRWEEIIRLFETMEPFVLCFLHGYCLGGALQLTLGCDISIATPSVKLGLPAIRESLIPGLGTLRLPRYIGLGRAKQLILSGDQIDGTEAQRIGLVDHLVNERHATEEFDAYVKKYTANTSKGGRMAKRAMNEFSLGNWQMALDRYLELQDEALCSEDFQKACAVYQEKKKVIVPRQAVSAK